MKSATSTGRPTTWPVTVPRTRMRRFTSPRGRVLVDAAYGADRQRERVGRWIEDLDVARALGEHADAAELPGLAEKGAHVAAHPDAGVDQAREVLGREVPEGGPHHSSLDRHLGEQGLQGGVGEPGPLDDPLDLGVVAVVAAREHGRVGQDLRLRQRAAAQLHDLLGIHVGREPAASREALDLDDGRPASGRPSQPTVSPSWGGNTYWPDSPSCTMSPVPPPLLEEGHRAHDPHRIAAGALVEGQHPDLLDPGQERKRGVGPVLGERRARAPEGGRQQRHRQNEARER